MYTMVVFSFSLLRICIALKHDGQQEVNRNAYFHMHACLSNQGQSAIVLSRFTAVFVMALGV